MRTPSINHHTPAKTTGLVLGKFAPLHRGHQFLIETAISACHRVYVLIYESHEVIDIPLNVRADWIRHLYPDVHVIEGWGAPSASGHDKAVMHLQEAYVKSVLPTKITHFFSSEWYGEHMSKALGAENVVVDMDRKTVPVSATIVRANPQAMQAFVDPYVYKDLVQRVVFLGAESTGKSTLTQAVAQELGTVCVPEVGRAFWDAHHDANGELSGDQLVELIREHEACEDRAILEAKQFLFVDTNAITTRYYDQFYHGQVHPELDRLAHQAVTRYTHWFVCDTDIAFEQDGTRQDEAHQARMQTALIAQLNTLGITYTLVSGSLKERLAHVRSVLGV